MGLNEKQIEAVKDRTFIITKCDNDLVWQKEFRKKCQDDPIFWFNRFCWTYDPRNNPSKLPFILYPFQEILVEELISHIDNKKDLFVEKSRDMGASWVTILVFQWYWLFRTGSNFKVGSKKFEFVDDIGEISTLMEKFRFNLRLLPPWLRPPNFDFKHHNNKGKIINPDLQNSFTGEASNPDFSRSGRYSAVYFDEFAFWEHDDASWRAAADSTPCRIVTSTPHPFCKFQALRHDPGNTFIDVASRLEARELKLFKKAQEQAGILTDAY